MASVRLTLARFTEYDRDAWLSSANSILSRTERERIASVRGPDLRAQHAIGRALIRLIGAEVSRSHPKRLAVAVSPAGKPCLADIPDLQVSVAHTGRVVVVAACPSVAVGVDIEAPFPAAAEARRLAERLFAQVEVAALRTVPETKLADWVSSAWTIKEAVGKALGVGLVPALSGAVVEAQAQGLALTAVWEGPPADSWSVHQLRAPRGAEKIAIALPAPGVALDSVSQLSLEAFSRACSQAER